MAKLIATPPVTEGLPVTAGNCTLTLTDPGPITALAPFNGQDEAFSKTLRQTHGLEAPAPGHSTASESARCLWTGRGQVMLLGVAPDAGLTPLAAVTDQSDAWACFRLKGAVARDVLARLTPLDLHPAIFPQGATARSLVQHMTCILTRVGADTYDIMVFRSMAGAALHDLATAMKSVAAQG